jgi:hypothetical protein
MSAEGSLLQLFQERLALSDLQLNGLRTSLMVESLPLMLAFEQIPPIESDPQAADHLKLPLLGAGPHPEKRLMGRSHAVSA